jgi:hypothetical protein
VLAVCDGYGGSSLYNPGERGEDLTDFTRRGMSRVCRGYFGEQTTTNL